jgi:taurine dioxygenase
VELKKAAGALGAYVGGVTLAGVAQDDGLFNDIHEAVIDHQVLFLRDQNEPPAAFAAFARRFGEIEGHPAYETVPQAPDVQILESTAERPSKIEVWHSDMTFREQPPTISLLHGQIIPEYGGDTLWASSVAAYDALSTPMKTFLEPLRAINDFRFGFRESLAEPGGEERLREAVEANPPISHPVIRTHPISGRKAIYVNALFTSRIEGLSEHESREILQFLYRHIVTEEFTVRLNWAPQTVAIWDNRSTQHKPVNDFFPQHRLMHRVTIAGDRPV